VPEAHCVHELSEASISPLQTQASLPSKTYYPEQAEHTPVSKTHVSQFGVLLEQVSQAEVSLL
jgi:hypothetical protein